jgi:hypothetical protein
MHVTGAQTCDTVSAKWPENESKVICPPLTGEYPLLSHDTVVSSSTRILLTGADWILDTPYTMFNFDGKWQFHVFLFFLFFCCNTGLLVAKPCSVVLLTFWKELATTVTEFDSSMHLRKPLTSVSFSTRCKYSLVTSFSKPAVIGHWVTPFLILMLQMIILLLLLLKSTINSNKNCNSTRIIIIIIIIIITILTAH